MLSKLITEFDDIHYRLSVAAISGYLFALHVRSASPRIFHITYPKTWWDEYSANHYILCDPTVLWGALNNGAMKWSEIEALNSLESANFVMERAKKYGLNYGVTISLRSSFGKRMKSFFSASRSDREFTDAEIRVFNDLLEQVTTGVENSGLSLSPLMLETLEWAAKGLTHKKIGLQLGKSPDAIKKRLERARNALGVESTIEAVLIANERGLIQRVRKDYEW